MIKTSCINPEILSVLAKCGHGDQILIAGANFPVDSRIGPDVKKVYLGVSPGLPTSTQVLEALTGVMNIEQAKVTCPANAVLKPETHEFFFDIDRLLPGIELQRFGRDPYYDECSAPTVRLVIQTGDMRRSSNVLLTMALVRD